MNPDIISQEILDFLGIDSKNVTAINIRIRPKQFPSVVVQSMVKCLETESNYALEPRTTKYILKEVN